MKLYLSIIVTLLSLFFTSCNNNGASFNESSGEGSFTIYTSKVSEAKYLDEIARKAWEFSRKYPNANTLTVKIIDECKDFKGNISNYETKLEFKSKEIKEWSTYKDLGSFTEAIPGGASDITARLVHDYSPCGNKPF